MEPKSSSKRSHLSQRSNGSKDKADGLLRKPTDNDRQKEDKTKVASKEEVVNEAPAEFEHEDVMFGDDIFGDSAIAKSSEESSEEDSDDESLGMEQESPDVIKDQEAEDEQMKSVEIEEK